ncbi:EamA family transporter [Arthrospira platensis NCB002]|uniref:DMT family transporter n=1 Tax=Limnospira platensis TaxID=118562 RepID=UPI002970F5D7|nr:EamA family transporter [Arthrospira platensis NCB002]
MGKQDYQPQPSVNDDSRPPEEVLNAVIQEVEAFHRNFRDRLSQDVLRLQQDKDRLIADIENLQRQHQELQSQKSQTLSERDLAQQRVWLKQLAQILANNLQRELIARINQIRVESDQPLLSGEDTPMLSGSSEAPADLAPQELEAVLEGSLNQTFHGLQQELNSYHSDLSERLSNMQTLEQQVETLLETVVNRLRQQLNPTEELTPDSSRVLPPESGDKSELKITHKPKPPQAPNAPSSVQVGLFLALMSALVLSLFNVCLRILLKTSDTPKVMFGLFEVDGVITPGLGNSLLILLLRMIVVMLLMPFLATFLYPAVWSDIRRFFNSGDSKLMATVIGSGFFLFLSQVCIYIAIGEIPTGIAITIFFVYPIITVLASWGLFGDRPSLIRIGAMFTILIGGILSLPNFFGGAAGNTEIGVLAALGAGIAFAGYVLLTQIAAGKLHPIPFSLVNFASIFVFCSLSLMLLPDNLGLEVNPDLWNPIIIGGAILGVLTLLSYLLNNFAIRSAGAALASIIGTSGPALTALLAFLIIGEALSFKQISGMGLVIIGVGSMSVERIVTC